MVLNRYKILIIGVVFLSASHGYAAGNTCVTCHESLLPSKQRAHDFTEWRDSIHARRGVTCDQCHGGDATSNDVKQAHLGIVKSTQANSPLYFKRVADACGKCHAPEAAEYKKSFHAKELARTGRGPNCTTCHGSMATRILNPQELEQTCSLCHSLRPVASEALVTLNQAGAALKRWQEMVASLKAQHQVTSDQEAALASAQQTYKDTQRKWHSLDMQAVLDQSHKIITDAKAATQLLRLKMGTPK